MRIWHRTHVHLPSALHGHRVSMCRRRSIWLAGIGDTLLLLRVWTTAHPVHLRALHHHEVHTHLKKTEHETLLLPNQPRTSATLNTEKKRWKKYEKTVPAWGALLHTSIRFILGSPPSTPPSWLSESTGKIRHVRLTLICHPKCGIHYRVDYVRSDVSAPSCSISDDLRHLFPLSFSVRVKVQIFSCIPKQYLHSIWWILLCTQRMPHAFPCRRLIMIFNLLKLLLHLQSSVERF